MAKAEITNKLLKEAIADAEAVRQTAIENAKLSLEETFTPQIKSMLSRRLRAEAEGMEDEEEKEGPEHEKAEGPEHEKKEAPTAPKAAAPAAPKMETAKELPHQDGEAEGGDFADTSVIGSGDNKEPSADAFDSSEMDDSGEAPADSATDWYDDWSESDFDLDEVIRELEEDMKAFGKEEGEEEGEAEEAPEAEETADEAYPDEDPEAGVKKPEIPPHSSKIGTEGSADVAKFVAEPAEPKIEGEMGAEAPTGTAPEMNGHEEGEEELDLEQILRELEVADNAEEEKNAKIASLEKELAEYRTAFKLVREKLNEVNLLNAKLLYTNKILHKEGLSNEQRVSIVENFDRATSVREVKMVYAVLVETLTSAARSVKSTKPTKKVVTEGLASKATPSTAPKAKATEIIEENSVVKRLQQLAGII